jgi:prepilin-type N-terminal cleavage/methylation domain-containing protein/prepilin-type processing-associated H-X9-DG protein
MRTLHFKSGKRSLGFTLIELLVVIAIIAVLASILFPVFARARDNARRASCSSNLKQIGLGIMQYTQDYDEKYPILSGSGVKNYSANGVGPNWIAQVQPYVKSWQLFVCPSARPATHPGDTGDPALVPTGNSNTNYFSNGVLIGPSYGIRSLASVDNAAEVVMVSEGPVAYALAFSRPILQNAGPNEYIYWNYGTELTVHFDGANLVFADGHVKWKRQDAICSADFGLLSASGGNICGPVTTNITTTYGYPRF